MIRPDSRVWFPLFSFVATLIAVPAVSKLALSEKYTVALSSLIAALLFLLLERITDLAMSNYKIRKILDKSSKFEGEWIEYYVGDDKMIFYAYFRIRYTGKEGEPYIIKGMAYYPDGRNFATWTSTRIKFDRTSNKIDYFYFGQLFDNHDVVRGFACFNFNDSTTYAVTPELGGQANRSKAHKGDIYSGTGFFVDTTSEGARRNKFHFVRVDDELVIKTLGHDLKTMSFEQERMFVVSFHKKFGDGIVSRGYLLLGDGSIVGPKQDDVTVTG